MKNQILFGIGTSVLALGLNAQAQEVVQEEPKPTIGIFTGTLDTPDRLDHIFHLTDTNGAQLTAEVATDNWAPDAEVDATHQFSLGARTPKLSSGLFRLSGAFDTDNKREKIGWTGFLESFPLEDLVLRGGAFQLNPHKAKPTEVNIGGLFVGGQFSSTSFTADGDVWFNGTRADTHGYVAFDRGIFYGSVGGSLGEKVVGNILSLRTPGSLGAYHTYTRDFNRPGAHSGKLVLADRFTYGRGDLDFRSHIYSGTEMRRVATGHILDSWAPFDADVSERASLVADWRVDTNLVKVAAVPFWKAGGMFLGLGGGFEYDRTKRLYVPKADLQLYARVPDTPLDAWIALNTNVRTGETAPTAYVGASF